MTPKTFVFIGRSGCGKGTQAALLMDYIKKHDSDNRPIFYLETGQRFRDFIKSDNYSAKLSSDIYASDKRQPDFLAVWMWSHLLVDNLKGGEHIIIDGTPRSLAEAEILETAVDFYGLGKPYVIHLEVGRKWSEKHLLARGRSDDANIEKIKQRLHWFDTDVVPAISFLKQSQKFHFVNIDGEQSVEATHLEIMKKLSVFGSWKDAMVMGNKSESVVEQL